MMVWMMIACAQGPSKGLDTATNAATSDTATDTTERCDDGWDGWANGFFATYCRSCHAASSATRYGAPADVNFDTREDAVAWLDRVRVRVLEDETMPVGGGVPETDLTRLETWVQCVEMTP